MGAFTAAVLIPKGGRPTVEHSVAVAMEPYRQDPESFEGWWTSYAIGPWSDDQISLDCSPANLPIWAFIDRSGIWHCQLHPHEISPSDGEEGYNIPLAEWREEIRDFLGERALPSEQIVIVRCKD
jgi:hypothetical protein